MCWIRGCYGNDSLCYKRRDPELARASAEGAFCSAISKCSSRQNRKETWQHLKCNWVMTQFRHVEIQFDHHCADTEVRFVGLGVHVFRWMFIYLSAIKKESRFSTAQIICHVSRCCSKKINMSSPVWIWAPLNQVVASFGEWKQQTHHLWQRTLLVNIRIVLLGQTV